MRPPSSLDDLQHLYETRGHLRYGEGVTQLEHALQCAALAERDRVAPSLIVAALLHDLGHLLKSEDREEQVSDDRHEIAGARALARLFPEAVCAPVALHVDAKRYLCFKEQTYFAGLSTASRRSLVLQGGPFEAEAASEFEYKPGWTDAVTLRRFDDAGKCDTPARKTFADYLPAMRGLLRN